MILGGFVAFIGLAAYRFAVQTGAFRNSDDAANFLAGAEMAEGDWNLHGWIMAPDNYYPTEVLAQAVLKLLFGWHPIFMQLEQGLVWAAVAFAGTYLACSGMRARHLPGVASIALALLAFNVFEHAFRDVTILNIGSHGLTILLTLLTFGVVGLSGRPRRRRARRSVLLACLMVTGTFADPIFVVIACLPVASVSALGLAGADRQGKSTDLAIALGAIVVGRSLVVAMGRGGGFDSLALPVSFATFPDLLSHLGFAAESITRLLGAEFFGRTLGGDLASGPIILLLRAPFVLMLVIAFFKVGGEMLRRVETWPADRPASRDDLEPLLWLSFSFCVASTCITTVIVDEPCVRFFLPAAVTGSILTARRFGASPLPAAYGVAGLVLSVIFGVLLLSHRSPRRDLVIPQLYQLMDVLREHHLQHGYGGYWETMIVTVMSNRDITSLPLMAQPDGRLHPLPYFVNLDWFRRAAREWRGPVFFVSERGGQSSPLMMPEEAVHQEFGHSAERIDLGLFIINVYDVSGPELKSIVP